MRKSRDNNNNNKLLYDPNQRQARRLGAFSMEENVDDEDNLEVIEEVSEDVNNDYESNEVENSTQEQESATETTNNNKTQLTKNAKDSVVNVVQDKAKNAVKKKALSFIASNPWVLAVLAGVIVLFIILLLLLGSADDDTDGIYEESCDFNKTMVVYGACGSELSDTYTLKEYVINITKKIAAGRDMDENELKALMIIVKTNALSSGNYNNTDKSIDIDDCDFNNLFTDSDETLELDSLYEEIEGDLYLSTTYSGTIYSLSSSNMLELDEDILESMSSSGGDYEGILDNIYRQSNQDNEEVTVYQNNIYIGDSRTNQTRLYGIIPNESTIYGAGYGYNWFIGNGSFSSDYTNALSGAIDGADSIMDSNSNYNIIINLGINGISTYGAEIFYQEYYELATGKWSNNNIYVVEVGPVDEERSAIRNSTIDEFNENMASLINTSGLSNLMYIDINYNISYYDTEGIHYGYSDYQDIYEQTMNKLSSPFESNANYGIYHLIDNCEFSESTDSDTYTNSCESIPIYVNSLSKSEFVSKVQAYYSNATKSYTKVFYDNASTIYDIAENNNFNAELVVIRAYLEGYSPVSQGYTSYNNYYGIGCNNGASLSSCTSYTSFDAGVLGYINLVKGYGVDSLLDVYYKKHYAYIGNYWTNPGDAGTGGCYYYESIKKYLSESRREEVEAACNGASCSGSSCLATNDEDKLAYSKYQIQSSINARKKIFDIDATSCNSESGGCTIYKQGDLKWGSIKLGNSSLTMRDSGCAVTAIAIGISCSGTSVSVQSFDAGVFVKALNEGNCFTSSGSINWGCSAIKNIAPNLNFLTSTSVSGTVASKISQLNSLNTSNRFILIHFVNSAHPRGHFIVYESTSGEKFIGKDPASGKIISISVKDVDQYVVYSY